jgi:CRP-like cAMP-binding protein
MRTIEDLVVASPVFAGLEPAQLALVAGCAQNMVFAAGEYLFREGAPADAFYLVRKGRVALETFVPGGGALMLETIEPDEVVGWSWLFPPHRWHSDARAIGVVHTVAFDGLCLRGKCADDHDLGYELMQHFAQVIAERLDAARLRLVDLYGHGAPA